MNYCLYNLKFTTPVHFGNSELAHSLDTTVMTCCADTLFSALCHAAFSIGGNEQVQWLIHKVQNNELRFSDCMPCHGVDRYYLPRPCCSPAKHLQLPEDDRKVVKKAEWIPVDTMDTFLSAMRGETVYDWSQAANTSDFGNNLEFSKVQLFTNPDTEKHTEPYTVGAFQFHPDMGLYFILQYAENSDSNQVKTMLDALGYSGIGGKTSSGYGRFSVEKTTFLCFPKDTEDTFDETTQWFYHALHTEQAKRWLLISASLPEESELDRAVTDSQYQIVRRGGFSFPVYSEHSLRKKKTQYFFASGSVFENRYHGALYTVGNTENHAIYRYGKPIFLGVNL